MANSPFRFLDSPALVTKLRQALAQVGLLEQETGEQKAGDEQPMEPNPYHPGRMGFVCGWLSKPVELHWHYSWWPDGTYSELDKITVLYDGVVRGEVNVAELLRQRLPRPLAEVIIEGVVALCTELTGKRRDHAT
jgi:hypothetical protein